MSDETKTGEQALAEGRGKIELPTVEEVLLQPLPQTTEDTKDLTATKAVEAVLTAPASDFIADDEHSFANYEEPIDAVAAHEEGSITVQKIVEAALGFEEILPAADSFELGSLDISGLKPEDFFPQGVKIVKEGELPSSAEIVVQKNKLGTQDFCPSKEKCNHLSPDHCKQAKLEADHRRDCLKGESCDCFHATRGIPSAFRFKGSSNDGRIR